MNSIKGIMIMCDWICDMINWIKMIDWNTCLSSGFGAFFGALGVLLLSIHLNDKKQNAEDKEELIKYFYNLNTALRNLSTCANNIEQVLKIFREKNELVAMPASYLDFLFNEEKLEFVKNFNILFYESINILKIDLKGLFELAILFKEEKKEFYVFNLRSRLIISLLQVMQTMKNVDDFLQIYENSSTLINSQVVTNFRVTEDYVKNYKTLLKEDIKNSTNDEQKEAIKKYLCIIENTETEWKIKFKPQKPWYKKIGDKKKPDNQQ